MSAIAALLPDGRLHLQHGPIDCLCRAWGEPAEVRAAYRQAAAFFADVLDELCRELPLLRQPLPVSATMTEPQLVIGRESVPETALVPQTELMPPVVAVPGLMPSGKIARAMHTACLAFADRFITPMAAVAGAVADAVLAAMIDGRALTRGFVNNGGDIAFHLTPGESLRCGLVTDLGRPVIPNLDGSFLLTADDPPRGLATSGRACKGHGGRSFSFGIADSVTVLARTAAQADAAATVIANAVDLPGHEAIDRRPATGIDPASDLGERLITFDVGPLSAAAIATALDAGECMADSFLRRGLIDGAVLALRGSVRVCNLRTAAVSPDSLSRNPLFPLPLSPGVLELA